MKTRLCLLRMGFLLPVLLSVTGCIHDIDYVSAKSQRFAQTFTPLSLPADLKPGAPELAVADSQTAARYTSSYRVTRETRRDPNMLGTVYFRTSEDPEDEGIAFNVRKEYRGYTAQTPLPFLPAFEIGKQRIEPQFSLGVHKDHKGMIGIVFRLPLN